MSTTDAQAGATPPSFAADCSDAVAIVVRSKRGSFLVDWSKHFDREVEMAGVDFKDQGWKQPPEIGYWKWHGELINNGEGGVDLRGHWFLCAGMVI